MYTIACAHGEFMSADQNDDDLISANGIKFVFIFFSFLFYYFKISFLFPEIHPIFTHLKVPLENELVMKEIMNKFDINNDSVLNFGEFFLLYIFLTELVYPFRPSPLFLPFPFIPSQIKQSEYLTLWRKVYEIFKTKKPMEAHDLSKLLDDTEKQIRAAKELEIFSQVEHTRTMTVFAIVIGK